MTQRWLFSFGQRHTHRIGEFTADCDCLLEIEGEYETARARMIELCGIEWSHQYAPKDVNLKFFPRGVHKVTL